MNEFSPAVIIAVALIILATLSLLAAFGWWLGGLVIRWLAAKKKRQRAAAHAELKRIGPQAIEELGRHDYDRYVAAQKEHPKEED